MEPSAWGRKLRQGWSLIQVGTRGVGGGAMVGQRVGLGKVDWGQGYGAGASLAQLVPLLS